jgi:hypothetical protein
MRSKATGLVQHGGPPGWLEESDQRDQRRVAPVEIEIEVNGVSKSTNERGPFLIGFLGLSRQYKIFLFSLGCSSRPSTK